MNDYLVNYFAYGSNLCLERLKLSIPNVLFCCLAKLDNYELIFSGPVSSLWKGSPANIRPKYGSSVCGVVWRIRKDDIAYLDKQEGVSSGIYKQIFLSVNPLNTNGGFSKDIIECLSYIKVNTDTEEIGLPSPMYKNVILYGACSNSLPSHYITYLDSFKDNGHIERIDIDLPEEILFGK
jgi:gamma-glutamylcyclotransferase